MKDLETRRRFVELRALGKSYREIAKTLDISRATAATWAKEMCNEIANARTLMTDEIVESLKLSKAKRLERLGQQLNSVSDELSRRDLKEVSTGTLLRALVNLDRQVGAEMEPMLLRLPQNERDMFEAMWLKEYEI